MNTETLEELLQSLESVGFGANLAGGKIYWTNAAGTVVAHAECKAILSWAATNNSAMWAHAIGQFQDAGVPVLKPANYKSDYIGNINDDQAAKFATEVAEEGGAQFVYRAPNGANGLYLAVFNLKAESKELNEDDYRRKRNSSINYIMQMIANLAEILRNKKRT
jgi:hypothetical protein